jgi:hypothetical protein
MMRVEREFEVMQYSKGGAGAVLAPMWRKRNFLGRGGMPYHHKILLTTKDKALRQKGACFVANVHGPGDHEIQAIHAHHHSDAILRPRQDLVTGNSFFMGV